MLKRTSMLLTLLHVNRIRRTKSVVFLVVYFLVLIESVQPDWKTINDCEEKRRKTFGSISLQTRLFLPLQMERHEFSLWMKLTSDLNEDEQEGDEWSMNDHITFDSGANWIICSLGSIVLIIILITISTWIIVLSLRLISLSWCHFWIVHNRLSSFGISRFKNFDITKRKKNLFRYFFFSTNRCPICIRFEFNARCAVSIFIKATNASPADLLDEIWIPFWAISNPK